MFRCCVISPYHVLPKHLQLRVSVSNDSPNRSRNQSMPWLFAHRGTSTLAPENTIAAFEIARSARAEVLEIDVRISHDRQIIVTHDASVVRTTNGTGLVAKQTIDELKTLDAGYCFTTPEKETPWRGQDLKLITLSELFQAFPEIGINIDIKDSHPEAATIVAEELRKLSDGRWLNVGSFHQKTINAFRQQAPEISTAAARLDVAALFFGRKLPPRLCQSLNKKSGGQVLQIPERWGGLALDSAGFIDYIHQQNRLVMYWTINNPDNMLNLLNRGANGIVSDNVVVAREIIDQFIAQRSM